MATARGSGTLVGIAALVVCAAVGGGLAAAPAAGAQTPINLTIQIPGSSPIGYMTGTLVTGPGAPAEVSLTLRGSAEMIVKTCLRTTVYPASGRPVSKTRTYPAQERIITAHFPRFTRRSLGRVPNTRPPRVIARMTAHIGTCAKRPYARATLRLPVGV